MNEIDSFLSCVIRNLQRFQFVVSSSIRLSRVLLHPWTNGYWTLRSNKSDVKSKV